MANWSIGIMTGSGAVLSRDGFILHLNEDNFQQLISVTDKVTEITDVRNSIVTVEPIEGGLLLIRQYDETFPLGVELMTGDVKPAVVDEVKAAEEEGNPAAPTGEIPTIPNPV